MDPKILELCREDPRFAYEAYEFVCDAVTFTQDRLGRDAATRRTTRRGPPRQRGGTAPRRVRTGDPRVRHDGPGGVQASGASGPPTTSANSCSSSSRSKRLSKSDRDDPDDFHDLFDLHQALADGFALTLGDTVKRGDR